ncbi:MAG: NAD+ synthase [Candidatus Acidiferrales bacterium]
MKIALAQFNPTVGDFAGNAARIKELACQARQRGAELAVFSELCLCGYPPQDLVERPAFVERNQQALAELAEQIPLPSIIGYVGKARSRAGKPVANAAALIADGKVQFEQQKMLLPTYDVFDESRYFQPAQSQSMFALGGAQLAITICEDIWNDKNFWAKHLYARDPVAELVASALAQNEEQGSAASELARRNFVLINISASPYTLEKRGLRLEMLRALAVRHKLPVVYVNQVGGNDSLVFDGSSVALTADGRVAAQAHSFAEDLVVFDTAGGTGDLRAQPQVELEAAYQALVTGTRDYVCKCGFRAVALGLSGGIDSALVACIAANALGPENVHGVAMPGPFSSEGSLGDARELAARLGIKFSVAPINGVYAAYRAALAPTFAGRPEDSTEENIQSRIRGNFLMAISNKFGALVLTTGNKSEMAVGYCTLYGDMAGALAVISDVPKTMVYALANWINRQGEVIPAATIKKPPSAELRANQTDQDSLPPYSVLDGIVKMYVEDLRSVQDIADHYDFDPVLVRAIIDRIHGNEFKRQQAAPCIKITAKAFGVGRTVPIAQKFRD